MSGPARYDGRMPSTRGQQQQQPAPGGGTNLADILERVLDKGIVIAGDVQINLLDIELLTIKLRLVVASVDRAKEMGIDWWERDPTLSSGHSELEQENRRLRERLEALEGSTAGALANGADPDVDVEDPDPADVDDDAEIEDAEVEDDLPDDDLPDDDLPDDDLPDDELPDDEPLDDEPEPEAAPPPRRRRSTRREANGRHS